MTDIAILQKTLMDKNRMLYAKITEQPELIEKYGQAEHDYRVALAVKMLELRTSGEKVTLIPDIAKGDKIIADLKLKRDIAYGVSDACREAIRAIQNSMSSIQTLISSRREEMKLV